MVMLGPNEDRRNFRVTPTPQSDPATRHAHRRQAVRRHTQRHHWRFYKARGDWTYVGSFAAMPLRWARERLVLGAVLGLLALLGFVVLPGFAAVAKPRAIATPLATEAIALPNAASTAALAAPKPSAEWKRVVVSSG